MKSKKHGKKSRKKVRVNHKPHGDAAPPAQFTTIPAEQPLAGESLELKVADVLCTQFRRTDGRKKLREACCGAEQIAIEAAIVSPRVQNIVKPVTRAFALEHTIAVIRLILYNAKAALETEKPTSAQVTALKIVYETFAEKMMERIGGGHWEESTGLFDFSDYEKCLIENLLQTVRGLRTPAAEDPQRMPDYDQNSERGD